MKICLLGGSNSILKMGLSHGLLKLGDIQLALGASSSIQNIYSLVKNKKNIEECDVIVSESNVNDFHNISIFKFEENIVLKNIRFLYDELYRSGKMIVSVILPVRISMKNVASIEVQKKVNELHRVLSRQYGFYLIDVDKDFSTLYSDPSLIKVIMNDTRHPLDSFMYMLGVNLRSYLSMKQEYPSNIVLESNFAVSDGDFSIKSSTKKNSMFQREVKKISLQQNISFPGFKLCGIETWSNGISQLKITDLGKSNYVIKQFSSSLQFNEICSLVSDSFSIESVLGSAKSVTEPCVDKSQVDVITEEVMLVSVLLIQKDANLLNVDGYDCQDISFLIPDKYPHILSVTKSLEGIKKQSTAKPLYSSKVVNGLRDSAIALEDIDLNLSLQLMSIAHEMRPNGPFIKNKIDEYEVRISKANHESICL